MAYFFCPYVITMVKRNRTMKGGSGLIAAAKSLLLPALFFLGQKFQQKRVTMRRRKRDMKKTMRRRY
jgi:hypothetical protein